MKTLYFDCRMGAAGDMVTAALLELLEDKKETVNQLNQIGLPGILFQLEEGEVMGSQMHVKINGKEESVPHGEEAHEHGHHGEGAHGHGHHHGEEAHRHAHHHGEEVHEHTHHHGKEAHEHGHHHGEEVHEHTHQHHHEHHNLSDIMSVVEQLQVKDKVKEDIREVFTLIAKAEGEVHRKTMDQIHFHEVGTMDALADVTAVCYLMDKLAPEKIMASPVHVGSGQVRCAHGILPVPAPATAKILRGVPIYGGKIEGELCTPTGAAILKYFVSSYGDMPVIALEAIGYGLGSKKFETANCVTAYFGETEEK